MLTDCDWLSYCSRFRNHQKSNVDFSVTKVRSS